ACDQGSFGAGCAGKCACSNGGRCDPVTGACSCAPGWRGKKCDRPCQDGHFGPNCALVCTCHSDFTNETFALTSTDFYSTRCYSVTLICSCPAGWAGPDCRTPCPPRQMGTGLREA
ncbi:hypothetical protein PMAYCL1PPCAC_09263, partial [Pristionchus mayeri]